jgi:hypothetical protein
VSVRISLTHGPVLILNQGRTPRETVRVDSFPTRFRGRIVVISDIYSALKKLTGTPTGGLIDALFAMEG